MSLKFWSDTQVEEQTGGALRTKTLRHWRLVGGGPVYFKVGRRCFYKPEDVEAFLHRDRRGGADR